MTQEGVKEAVPAAAEGVGCVGGQGGRGTGWPSASFDPLMTERLKRRPTLLQRKVSNFEPSRLQPSAFTSMIGDSVLHPPPHAKLGWVETYPCARNLAETYPCSRNRQTAANLTYPEQRLT